MLLKQHPLSIPHLYVIIKHTYTSLTTAHQYNEQSQYHQGYIYQTAFA